MKPKIVMTRPIYEQGIGPLTELFDVHVHEDRKPTHAELLELVKGADAIVTFLTDKITAEVMDAAGPQLKLIAEYSVGFDNIDLKAAAERGIAVTNTPGYISAPAVAEHAIALMYGVGRRLLAADAFTRAGKYKAWEPNLFLGADFLGRTVGIIGTGQIGSMFARICRYGLAMNVLYNDVQPNEALEKELGAQLVERDVLLRDSDVVSLHVPLLPSTHHLINAEALKSMKNTAILINTARGPVIDEEALADALKAGEIMGAGIDVFEDEPKVNPKLLTLENVIITPHIGSATEVTRIAMSECVAHNVIAFFTDKTPPNIVRLV